MQASVSGCAVYGVLARVQGSGASAGVTTTVAGPASVVPNTLLLSGKGNCKRNGSVTCKSASCTQATDARLGCARHTSIWLCNAVQSEAVTIMLRAPSTGVKRTDTTTP